MKTANSNLEATRQAKNKELSTVKDRVTELEKELESLGKVIGDRDKQVEQLQTEKTKLKTQSEDLTLKVCLFVC